MGLPSLTTEQQQNVARGEKPLELIQWLDMLDHTLSSASKAQLKDGQKQVLKLLFGLLSAPYGKPVRDAVSNSFAGLFDVAGTMELSKTLDMLYQLLRARDDSPKAYACKLASISILGRLFKRLHGMMSPFAADSLSAILKNSKGVDENGKVEILEALTAVVENVGHLVKGSALKETYRLGRGLSHDKADAVKQKAALLLESLSAQTNYIHLNDLESCLQALCKGFENTTHLTRLTLATTIARICAQTQDAATWTKPKPPRVSTLSGLLSLIEGLFIKFSSTKHGLVGMTQACALLFQVLGSEWLESNIAPVINMLVAITGSSKITSSSASIAPRFVQKCVQFIIKTDFGMHLGHKGRTDTVLALCGVVTEKMKAVDRNEGVDPSTTNPIIVALNAIAAFIKIIGNSINRVMDQVLPVVMSVALHPANDARVAAARCVRVLVEAVPSRAADVAEQCLTRLSTFRSSPYGLHGSSLATAATLSGAGQTALGLPQQVLEKVVASAKTLISLATKPKTSHRDLLMESGWLMLGSLVSMHNNAMSPHMQKLLEAWAAPLSAFNKGAKISNQEWAVYLRNVNGALSCIELLLKHQRHILTEPLQRQLAALLIKALKIVRHLPAYSKSHATLNTISALCRAKFYSSLLLIPAALYEEKFAKIMPIVVADITINAHSSLIDTTTILSQQCHIDENTLIEKETENDYAVVEEILTTFGKSGRGDIPNDPFSLISPILHTEADLPLPPPIAVVNESIRLFGEIYPYLSQSTVQLQLLQHLSTAIASTKNATRRQAIRVNVFSAILCALKKMAETKSKIKNQKVFTVIHTLSLDSLKNDSIYVRVAAAEAMGRLAQVTNAHRLGDSLAVLIDQVKGDSSEACVTGMCLAIGCLLRYSGSAAASVHLTSTAKVLLTVVQRTAGIAQAWALHSLMLLIDSVGFDFHKHINHTLQIASDILHTDTEPLTLICAGNVLNAIITTLGPELQLKERLRRTIWSMLHHLQSSTHPHVRLSALHGIQKLILFAPGFVKIDEFIPTLMSMLESRHFLLRHASVAIFRQLIQRDAEGVFNSGHGLDKKLMRMLDYEEARAIKEDARACVTGFIENLGAQIPSHWLSLFNSILSGATEKEDEANASHEKVAHQARRGDSDTNRNSRPSAEGGFAANFEDQPSSNNSSSARAKKRNRFKSLSDGDGESDGDDDDNDGRGGLREGREDVDDDDDEDEMAVRVKVVAAVRTILPTRWQTKVFSVDCVQKLIAVCKNSAPIESNAHFNLGLARDRRFSRRSSGLQSARNDFLVLKLAELIRTCFIAATSTTDQLQQGGMVALENIISSFAASRDVDLGDEHSILEQYQAQVASALRPMFAEGISPVVKETACNVCATWISSGVCKNVADLRRLLSLLSAPLDTIKAAPDTSYNERVSTMFRVGVLKCWARMYAQYIADIAKFAYLAECLEPHLSTLDGYWNECLHDYSFVSLPTQYASQIPASGHYYFHGTQSTVSSFYDSAFPVLVRVVSHRLASKCTSNSANKADKLDSKAFYMLLGLCMKSLASPSSAQLHDPEDLAAVLAAFCDILSVGRTILCEEQELLREVAIVLYNVTRAHASASDSIQLEKIHSVFQCITALATPALAVGSNCSDEAKAPLFAAYVSEDTTDSASAQKPFDFCAPQCLPAIAYQACVVALYSLMPGFEEHLSSVAAFEKKQRSQQQAPFLQQEESPREFPQPFVLDQQTKRRLMIGAGETTSSSISSFSAAMKGGLQSASSPSSADVGHHSNQGLERFSTAISGALSSLTAMAKHAPLQIRAEVVPAVLLIYVELLRMPATDVPSDIAKMFQGFVATLSKDAEMTAYFASTVDLVLDYLSVPGFATKGLLVVVAVVVALVPSIAQDESVQTRIGKTFANLLQNGSDEVRTHCAKVSSKLCRTRPISSVGAHFTASLGAELVQRLANAIKTPPTTETDAVVLEQAIATLEGGIESAAQGDTRVKLMAVYLSIAIAFLATPAGVADANAHAHKVKAAVVASIKKVGSAHNEPFRQVLASTPALKAKLQQAMQAFTSSASGTGRLSSSSTAAHGAQHQQHQKPKIQLTMNFSGFK